MAFGLRLTGRCWIDDLAGDGPRPDLLAAAEGSVAVREFLKSRRHNAEGTEGPIRALGTPFKKLKAGRERGATLWEREPQGATGIADPDLPYPGVVWLVAVGYRKDGDPDDAYEVFARLGADRLSPTEADYATLHADIRTAAREALRTDLQDALSGLVRNATAERGVLHRLDFDLVELGLAIALFESSEMRILVLPSLDKDRRPVSEELTVLIVAAVFGDTNLAELDAPDPDTVSRIARYALKAGEYALCRSTPRA